MTGTGSSTCVPAWWPDVPAICWCGHHDYVHCTHTGACTGRSPDVPPCTCKGFNERLQMSAPALPDIADLGEAAERFRVFASSVKEPPASPLATREASLGYHVASIPRGVLGEVSKIEEELAEFKDALAQRCSVMALLELTDLIGAIDGWLERYHPSIELGDLLSMTAITKRAFKSGHRQPKGG